MKGVKKIKNIFYEVQQAQSNCKTSTIKKLLNTIRWHCAEGEIEEVLAELREIVDINYEIRDMINDVVDELSEQIHICKKCGTKLEYETTYEFHTELDNNDIEKFETLVCPSCGYEE